MKKLIYIFVPFLLLLAFPYKANAYWKFAGMQVPTSFSEIKQMFITKKAVTNVSVSTNINDETTSLETITTDNPQNNTPTVNNTNAANLKTESANNSQTPDSWNISISETELNKYISSYLIGRTFAGYTVNKGSAIVEKGLGKLNLTINTDYGLYIELAPDSEGKNLIVQKLENSGARKLSGIELLATRQFVNNIKKIILSSFPEYKESFNKLEFKDKEIVITINN